DLGGASFRLGPGDPQNPVGFGAGVGGFGPVPARRRGSGRDLVGPLDDLVVGGAGLGEEGVGLLPSGAPCLFGLAQHLGGFGFGGSSQLLGFGDEVFEDRRSVVLGEDV